MNYKSIPIYIISYNRLEDLEKLIDFLESTEHTNINIINNASSYIPLLEYLKTTKHKVYNMNKNYGHGVFWKHEMFKEIVKNEYYVVTDPDILPVENCPPDFVEVFFKLLKKYPKVNKVGFSLKIDDLPDYYELKQTVIDWESKFYEKKIPDADYLLFDALLDTTFALYRPKKERKIKDFYSAIRVGNPYSARHLPWYKDLSKPNDEDLFYSKLDNIQTSTWNGNKSKDKILCVREKIITKFRLFDFIPTLKIVKEKYVSTYYLFGIIPFIKARTEYEN